MADDIEITITAMLAKLEAGMPAALDAISNERADDVVLDHPDSYTFGFDPDPRAWPVIMVVPVDSSQAQGVDDTGGLIIAAHIIQTWAWIVGDTSDDLSRKVLRYNLAMKQVMLRDRVPGERGSGAGYAIHWVRDNYSRIFRPPDAQQQAHNYAVEQMTRCTFLVAQQQNIL